MPEYQEVNGTSYHVDTDRVVIEALENARIRDYRVRLFYGDRETGRDWLEENDITGYVSRSMGPVKIPILLLQRKSRGGGGILDHRIVRLMVNGHEVYRHPKYQMPEFVVTDDPMYMEGTAPITVLHNGAPHARFGHRSAAERWVQFMLGNRMSW